MKIIDLLNKIANGEEVPKKIKYKENIYEYYKSSETIDYRYLEEETQGYGYLSSYIDYDTFSCLNDEVEIIEEDKKIEKLNKKHFHKKQRQLANKINEIIEVLNDKD